MRAKLCVGGVALLLAAGPLRAHHAPSAEFDANRPVKLQGTVTKMEWINPHTWLHIDVKGPDGKVVGWMVEGSTPNTLLRRGWTKKDVLAGTVVVVEGFRAKDGTPKAIGRDITLPDGRAFLFGSPGQGFPTDGRER